MNFPSMQAHTDPPPRLDEYECPYPGCSHTEWAFLPLTCPNRHAKLVLRSQDGGAR